jgi:hypothetical protein
MKIKEKTRDLIDIIIISAYLIGLLTIILCLIK